MPSSIKDYRQLIEKPWGRMFYDMIYRQIDLSNDKPLISARASALLPLITQSIIRLRQLSRIKKCLIIR